MTNLLTTWAIANDTQTTETTRSLANQPVNKSTNKQMNKQTNKKTINQPASQLNNSTTLPPIYSLSHPTTFTQPTSIPLTIWRTSQPTKPHCQITTQSSYNADIQTNYQPNDWPINQPKYQKTTFLPTSQSSDIPKIQINNQPTDWPTYKLINQPTNQPTK